MTNPPFILEHLEHIANILNHPFVFSYLHVPVQSGSNAILEKMKREYTVEGRYLPFNGTKKLTGYKPLLIMLISLFSFVASCYAAFSCVM